ncbi:MAG: hypothetical protein ACSHYA_13825 [Opitutaceae bacterium]
MKTILKQFTRYFCLSLVALIPFLLSASQRTFDVGNLDIAGGLDQAGGQLVISAQITDPKEAEEEKALIYAVDTQSRVLVKEGRVAQSTDLGIRLQHGVLKTVELDLKGDLMVENVSGASIASWSVRRVDDQEQKRQLVIALKDPLESGTIQCVVTAGREVASLPDAFQLLFFSRVHQGFLSGGMSIVSDDLLLQPKALSGLERVAGEDPKRLQYRFAGEQQSLSLNLNYLRKPPLNVSVFDLQGEFRDGRFLFTLAATVESFYDYKQTLPLLFGDAALTVAPAIEGADVVLNKGGYWLQLEKAGTYTFKLEFEALVSSQGGRSVVNFDLLNAPLQPIQVRGLPVASDRIRLNGAPLQASADSLAGSLSGDGVFNMQWTDPSWKSAQAADATLIYSTEAIAQVAVGNGLIRQRNDIDVQIMQGSMQTLEFELQGQGEITRVESDAILNWEVVDDALHLVLNKAYSEGFSVEVYSQFALGAFPVEAAPLRVLPSSAIRHSGFIRILNQGAVSIDVFETNGFAQISPEFFPATASTMQGSGQVLAYRFSDTNYEYSVRADNILPEVSVTQILQYHIGQEDQSLTAEMELTVREAPLRDFYIQVPEGYALADIKAGNLADYFITEGEGVERTLRLVFSQPQSGRILVRADFESNRRLQGDTWQLPRFAAVDVKSVRGHIGVSVDPGLRVSASSLAGLSEQDENFFPKQVEQLQLALRMREPEWQALLSIEQLPQSIQADALHLYSVAEGQLYGSSVINYLVSGAPVSSYRIQVPAGVQNLDFAGRDVRGWSEVSDGVFEVQLHSPAAGAYTLLATYESQFESLGETVHFSGVVPLGVDAEQGYVVAVSNFPFALGTIETSPGVLQLEPGEIPAEFRLLYDAQELAAFQYADRPMDIAMELRSYTPAQSADQIIDFVELKSHISRDGEILTAVDLMLKSKGQTHFRMQLPAEHRIWSARVAGEKVSPISADGGLLLPLPSGQDPNNAIRVQVELASQAEDPVNPVITAPALFAPALMVNWELSSDPGFGLRYSDGDISSAELSRPPSGFAWFHALLSGELGRQRLIFFALIFFGVLAIALTRVAALRMGEFSLVARILLIMGILTCGMGVAVFGLGVGGQAAQPQNLQDSLTLRTPVELSAEPLQLVVENREYLKVKRTVASLWPFAIGIALWAAALVRKEQSELLWMSGWVVNFIAALNYAASGVLFLVLLMSFFLVYALRPFRIAYLQRIGMHALWVFGAGLALFGSGANLDAAGVTHADSIHQKVVVEDEFAVVDAQLNWVAEEDEQIFLLNGSATLLSVAELPEGLRLVQIEHKQGSQTQLHAESAGVYAVDFRYQVKVRSSEQGVSEVSLPVGSALSSRARIEIVDTNVELRSKAAVSVVEQAGTNAKVSAFDVTFRAAGQPSFSWVPKKRDSSSETAVYHVESFDVFTPLSGLVSGYHKYKVRLSQGQVDRLQLSVPEGMTVTSVVSKELASWQFDPDSLELVCFFQSAQAPTFELSVYSQYSAATLPYDIDLQGLQVTGAASQLSLVALATDDEVQVGAVQPRAATTINLEDFPRNLVQTLTHLGRAPSIRRAYRWASAEDAISVEVLPVEPDLRVSTKQTVSLGEDRILVRAEISAVVNRAGLFKFSMPIPAEHDVESVSGAHLSHWNELMLDGKRVLQLHLKGKTLGKTSLQISLSGPGLGDASSYVPPILKLDGTDRQNGTLALVPELGYRLNPVERKAALQMDPAEAGMSRKKLLLFRILNDQAFVSLSVERVEPWVEVEKLQRVTIRSGLAEVKARFQFNVENAGIRSQRFHVPADAIGVQFTGEGVVDAQQAEDGNWLVKLNRKIVGAFTLDLSYQLPIANQANQLEVIEVSAVDVDQQSGFLALVPQGRIQLNPTAAVEGFQSTEVPMVDPKLRGDLELDRASHLYRLLQSDAALNVGILRHDVAELVPAQVRDVQLTSVISGQGSMLTKVKLMLDPGDKRMLRISLPEASEFWFGFVNQQSVWPWREGNDVLLQLETNAASGEDSVVEFFYATDSITAPKGNVKARLLGPKLDLPLENIKWSINYPETWEIHKWKGNLTREEMKVKRGSFSDLTSYLASEKSKKMKQKAAAEDYLNNANALLSAGKQQEARKAFNSAYNLSQFDAALNEDARVQLQNVREEQALVALANRRNSFVNDNAVNVSTGIQQAAVIGQDRLLNYTAQAKKDVLGRNTAEENETLRLLAARLIDQQRAVPGNPQAIQTIVPQHGRIVTFTRSLQINDQADLIIELDGKRQGQASFGLGMIFFLIALVGGVSFISKKS